MRVWIDCTAAAHPLVMRPIVERLEDAGHEVRVTAREYGQTQGVLERLGIAYESVGRHAGGGVARKGAAVARRSLEPGPLGAGPAVRPRARSRLGRLGRGRRGLLRIPSVQMQDYEYAGLQRQIAFRAARRVLAPDAIPVSRDAARGRLREEAVAISGPQGGLLPERLRAGPLRSWRSWASTTNWSWWWSAPRPRRRPTTPRTRLYEGVLDRLAGDPGSLAVVIPRTDDQARSLQRRTSGDRARNLLVPDRAIDAQSLIAFADLVVSAGGTMNREAVALGTPAYTIFSGRMGAVDERADRDGPPARPRSIPQVCSCESVRRSPGCGSPATRSSSWTESSRPWGSLARGRSTNASARPPNHLMLVDGRPPGIYALFAFTVAGVLAWLLVPFAERFARRIGAMDVPNERSLHDVPDPEARRARDSCRGARGRRSVPARGRPRPGRSSPAPW